ncbi:hypothetical protein [Paenibacillus sp. Soil522]|uniref:hypothetical protein n=1 Tax=Paenibacillus sp. Soil522 TaxID=1736388 RepID=UPI0006F89691|nr:hypothetical protein [Paenibacillus sp. Soil522]KRE41696.1 hypothetical protein ASG81_16445 [Paenibacillus sp. Soil522]
MLNLFVVIIFAFLLVEYFKWPEFVRAVIHLAVMVILIAAYGMFKQMIVAITIVFTAHYLLKWLKKLLVSKKTIQDYFSKKRTVLFVFELILNILIIYFGLYLFVDGFNTDSHLDNLNKIYNFLFGTSVILSIKTKIFCFLIIILLSSKVTSEFIALITEDLIESNLNVSKHKEKDDQAAMAELAEGQQLTAAAAAQESAEGYSRNLFIPPFPSFPSERLSIKKQANVEQYIKSEVDALHKLTKDEFKDFHIERTLEITEKADDVIEVKNKISYNTSRFNDSSPLIASYIGIFERLLISALVVKGAFTGIAFLGALKAMARYKQFDEKSYAEKFLLGTLISALSGLICGLLIMRVFDLDII